MNPIYTFDEFATHMEEITKLLGEERTPGEYAFERSVLRSSEYFKQYYTDERERVYKHGRFCLMMHYMSSHLKDFDRGDYAVFGSERVGALMSSHLLKAVHHVYTSDDILKRQSDPPPEEIMALAERFKESEL